MNHLIAQIRSLFNLDHARVIESKLAIQRFLHLHAKDDKMFGLVTSSNWTMLYTTVNSIAYVGDEMVITFNRFKPTGEFLCHVNFTLSEITRICEFSHDEKSTRKSAGLDLNVFWPLGQRASGVLC